MSTNIFEIEGIGYVRFTRRKGSKRISMRIKTDGIITVNYPWFTTQKEVINFVYSNHDWIKQQKAKLESIKTSYALDQTINLKNYRVKIVPIPKGEVRSVVDGTDVIITIPPDVDIKDESIQAYIQKTIVEVLRFEAKKYLPGRVAELAKRHNFTYNKVFIKNLKSKWGSCSSAGNINLNLQLMHLPNDLIDYIILHELSHTIEMNHGPNFWDVLNKVTNGNAKALDKRTKIEGRFVL